MTCSKNLKHAYSTKYAYLSQFDLEAVFIHYLIFLGFFPVSNYDQDRRRCRHGPSGLQCTDPGSPTVQTQKRSQRGVYI